MKSLLMMGLVTTGLASLADEVLYWMVDNPTITDWYGTQYQLADRSTTVKGNEMTVARVAAFVDQAGDQSYAQTRLDGGFSGDIVYLDLYYQDKSGSWILDNPVGQGNDYAFITEGTGSLEGFERAAVLASLGGKDLSVYSFAIELGTFAGENGEQWVLAAVSGTETYAALTGYIGEQLTIPDAGIWTPGAYSAPEPTSGLLTLMGLALLGLRRKKVVGRQSRGCDVPVASKAEETSLS